MPEERYTEPYVTADSSRVIYINAPLGLISPPTIELHESGQGPVTFYMASAYRLPVPSRATT